MVEDLLANSQSQAEPTPEEIAAQQAAELLALHRAALKAELQRPEYAGLSGQEAYDLLHLAQPVVTTRTVPKAMTLVGVLSQLSPESAGRLVRNSNLTDIRDKILGQDFQGVSLWLSLLVLGGEITQLEGQAMVAAMSDTEEITTTTYTSPRIGTAFLRVPGMPNLIEPEFFTEVFTELQGG
jgi:hypothetical protein